MKPREMFDVCHGRYKSSRAFLAGHMAAIDLESPSDGYHWRPDRARAEEYVADFEMIAQRALRRPEWRGRLKLFRVYFLRGFEYRRAITLCGVAPGTFDFWVSEVKKACGREFARTGLFPPGDYFRKREKSCPEDVSPEDGDACKSARPRRKLLRPRQVSPDAKSNEAQYSSEMKDQAAGRTDQLAHGDGGI